MIRLLFVLFLLARSLGAETLALYLSWYGDPTTTMTIQWHTPLSETGDEVSLRMPSGEKKTFSGSHIEFASRIIHTVLLDGLSPDTEYPFQIQLDPALYKLRTAPQTLDQPLRFVIGGDAYHSKEAFRKMNNAIVDKAPLFAVIGGDIAYAINGNPFRLRSTMRNRWFSFLREWKEQMILPDGQVIPFLLVAGNHDISSNDYELFFTLFAFPEKQLYRTVDFGNYLSLFLLDTGHFQPIEGEQTAWLGAALAKRKTVSYPIPVYHIAAYPSYYSFSGSIPKKIRANWCPLFEEHNLKAAFENHNHAFKRTYPIRNGKIDPTGVVYLGDGCWGVPPRTTDDHWYLTKRESKNHVYLLELTPESAKIEAFGFSGESIDQFEIIPREMKNRKYGKETP